MNDSFSASSDVSIITLKKSKKSYILFIQIELMYDTVLSDVSFPELPTLIRIDPSQIRKADIKQYFLNQHFILCT